MLYAKRIGLLLMAALMVFSLVACGGSDTPAGSNPSQPGSDPSSTPTSGKLWDPTGLDFGGRHFIIGMPGAWGPVRGDSRADDCVLDQIELVENTYNCTIEYKEFSGSGYHDMIASTALGGTYVADIMYTISTNVIPGYAKSGIVISPDDYNIFNYEDNKWNKSIANDLTWKGKRYTFSTLAFDSYNDLGAGVWFNKDLFEEYSVENPYKYYDEGTWTWDVMKEMANALTKDNDGDGENDQWGIAVNDDYYSFLFANGARLIKQDENGNWKYTLNTPEAVEALEYFIEFKTTDAHAPWLGDNTSSRITPFQQGKIGMLVANVSHASTYLKEGMEDDYGWVPFPKGPSATGYELYRTSTSCYIVPAPVQNPIQVFQVYDLMTDWVHNEGVDAVEMYCEHRVRDEETIENLRDAFEGGWSSYDMSNMVAGFKALTRAAIDTAWGGEVSAKTAVDSVADAAQQLVDQAFGG